MRCGSADELQVHMDSEHVAEESRSSSRSMSSRPRSSCRSFICPDCGLGVESIAALTAHLLTHARQSSCQSRRHFPAPRVTAVEAAGNAQRHDPAETAGDHRQQLSDDEDAEDGARDDDLDRAYQQQQQQQSTLEPGTRRVRRVLQQPAVTNKMGKINC